MKTPITLYTHAMSPYGQKVKCYLLFMGLEHETIYFNPFTAEAELPVGKTAPAMTYGTESRNESSELAKWLDALFPEVELIPEELTTRITEVDSWVSYKLIPAVMRDLVSYGESQFSLIKNRWRLSGLINTTVPEGLTFVQRILHLMFLGRAPFAIALVNLTDKSQSNEEVRQALADEFDSLLAGGPFLCGSKKPTMADLSAYPQITTPYFQQGEDYLLPGDHVRKWVQRMEAHSPAIMRFLPDEALYTSR